MRLVFPWIFVVAGTWPALGQTYTITTVAGGGLPGNVPGPSASLGQIGAVAVDTAGDVFIPLVDYHVVLRLDAVTGMLTRVAGNGTYNYGSDDHGDGGPATSAQLLYPTGVAVDGLGNLYIADETGIREVSNGVITTAVTLDESNGQIPGFEGVAVDGAGDLYYSNNRSVYGPAGLVYGPPAASGLFAPEGIAADSSYVYIADSGNAVVIAVASGSASIVAGGGESLADDIASTSARLGSPMDVALDASSNLYIADTGFNRIRKVTGLIANGVITTVAGNGADGFSGDNGPATRAGLSQPAGVAVDQSGNLFIVDTQSNRVREVSAGTIVTVAGGGNPGDNGPAVSAQLDNPVGVAVDGSGDLYIADATGNRIRKVSNGTITTLAGNGSCCFSGDNGAASSAQLSGPYGVAVDSAGNVFIADTGNQRIRKVSNGVIATVAGNGMQGFSGDFGPATSAELNTPKAAAADSSGNLYIADSGNWSIRKLSNGVIATIAGGIFNSPPVTNGLAVLEALYEPADVAVDSTGSLYIADTGDRVVRRISNGIITTVAGGGLTTGDNGPATSAMLVSPQGIAVDASGNLYIADTQAWAIRKVSGGIITTIAGGAGFGYGGDNGPATSAQLNSPVGIAVDASGNVYFADSGNNRIRMLVPSGASCTYAVSPPTLSVPASGGNLTVNIQTSSSCAWAVQSLPDWIQLSGDAMGSGSATVTLAVTANAGPPQATIVSIAGVSIQVTQPGPGPLPSINAGGVVNAASYAASVAPGSIAAAYGDFLLTQPSTDNGLPLSDGLEGLYLQFGNGDFAPLFFASAGQVNLQIPWEVNGQTQTTLSVLTQNGQAGAAQTPNLAPFAPGIFTINSQGTGQGAILDSSYRLVDSSNPATPGSTYILIYCTGLGAVANQPPTGSPALAAPLSKTENTTLVTIGGVPANVAFSGLAPGFVGLYQVNAQVPAGLAANNATPVMISIGGVASNTVTMAVQ
jgi:trimeric autotransporter adhesin